MNMHQAVEIMSDGLITLRQVEEALKIRFKRGNRYELETNVPFSAQTLTQYQDTHVLVPGHPLTLKQLNSKTKVFWSPSSWLKQEFACSPKVGSRWYLVSKEVLADSFEMTLLVDDVWSEQEELLWNNRQRVLKACELSYVMIVYYLVTEKQLLDGCFSLTSDFYDRGSRVKFGLFSGEAHVSYHWLHGRSNTGLIFEEIPLPV